MKVASALTAALFLSACAPQVAVDAPAAADLSSQAIRIDGAGPPPGPEGTCWAHDLIPAVFETTTEQTLITAEERDASGTLITPASYRSVSKLRVVTERRDIWFTAQSGNVIGRLTVATGEVRLVAVPTPRSRPYGIMMDPQDRPWIVLFGTNKIATVDPVSFALREYTLPRPETRPRRIAITSDGAIWYGDYAAGYLGRLDPRTEQVQEYRLPGGATSRPYAVMNDDRDRIWVVETGAQPNMFVGFDSRTRQFLPGRPVPSGGGVVRHMMFDPASHAIWFGSDNNTIGRAILPPAATVP